MAGGQCDGGELLVVQVGQKGRCGRGRTGVWGHQGVWRTRKRVLWEHAAIVETARRPLPLPMKNIVCTLACVLASILLLQSSPALAQASCSSDGTPRPVAIFERFISADCEACWTDAATPAPSATAGAVVLDWIVPGQAGDEAPLSAAATHDALARLQALGRTPPAATDVHTTVVEAAGPARLRVAHGLPFNDYLGTGITFAPTTQRNGATPGAMAFYLLLVESVPAGTDGTPVARNMVGGFQNEVHQATGWAKNA